MRILFDTNVLLDAVVRTRPYHEVANQLLAQAERGRIEGVTTPVSVATCWYVSTATYGVDPRPLFEYLSSVFDLARMGWSTLDGALSAPDSSDFEDQYIAAAGAQAGAELVVTRDIGDFEDTPLPPQHPKEVLESLREQ